MSPCPMSGDDDDDAPLAAPRPYALTSRGRTRARARREGGDARRDDGEAALAPPAILRTARRLDSMRTQADSTVKSSRCPK